MLYSYGKFSYNFFGDVSILFNFLQFSRCRGRFKLNNYSTRACWILDNYSQIGVTRLVGYLSSRIQRALVE